MARQDWKSSRSWAASFADLGSSSNVTKTSSTSIEMLSPNDGWAVGYQGLIRKDHNGWHVYPIITTGQLNLISMTSTSDGWMAGENGQLFHWNGSSWSKVSSPTPNRFVDLQMVSSSLGWAVDTDPNTFHYRLYRYNGAEWVEEKLPARYTRLEGLSMISAFEGYLPYINEIYEPEYIQEGGIFRFAQEPDFRAFLPAISR